MNGKLKRYVRWALSVLGLSLGLIGMMLIASAAVERSHGVEAILGRTGPLFVIVFQLDRFHCGMGLLIGSLIVQIGVELSRVCCPEWWRTGS